VDRYHNAPVTPAACMIEEIHSINEEKKQLLVETMEACILQGGRRVLFVVHCLAHKPVLTSRSGRASGRSVPGLPRGSHDR
jgi:hypothetical protein